jgi:hypothetical protein
MVEEKLLNAVRSHPARNACRHHAQQQGAGDGKKKLTPKQPKPEVSR